MSSIKKSRRRFLKNSLLGIGASAFAASNFPYNTLHANTPSAKKLGVALVGLGYYATNKLAPALEETNGCKLAGIVTGTPAKEWEWSKKYSIPKTNIYNYDNFDSIADNKDIDIVYVVLPNAMHAEFTIRAAKAGKHVICEKPMAISAEECKQMVAACKKAGVKLQIGYRCQYIPHHREIMRLGQQNILGAVTVLESSNAFYAGKRDNWRFQKKLSGGGPMMDMGIYSLQAVRYTMGKEPLAVTAQSFKTNPEKFKDIEETLFWQMEFENGVSSNCMTSYAARAGHIHVSTEQGSFGLKSAFGYSPVAGYINDEPMDFPHSNHQAVQMDAFVENILNDTPVVASGEDGLQDLKLVEAIYQAMESGKRVEIK